MAVAGALPARAQEVWFAPPSPHPRLHGFPDWAELFSPDAPWPEARAITRVFQFDGTYVMYYPPEELRSRAVALARHGIAVSVGIQPVTRDPDPTCGTGVEGFDDPRSAPRIARNLKAADVPLRYVTMDGALTFGHYYDGPRGCRYDVPQIVDRVAAAARAILDQYPDVTLIDVESSGMIERPDFADRFRRFKAGFEAAIGRKLEIVQLDMAWPDPTWPDHLRRWRDLTAALGMRLGIIYNGDSLDSTGEAWTAHAIRNFATIEGTLGVRPAQAVFAGWNKVPTHVLPETSPSAMTYPVAQYRLTRTRIVLTQAGDRLDGRLVDADGAGIAHARVEVAAGFEPRDPVPVRVWTGPVPPNAAMALLAVRINMECGCTPIANDVVLGPLTYRETGGGAVEQRFDPAAALARQARQARQEAKRPHVALSDRDGALLARIVTRPDQELMLNSEKFRVTPGAQATLRVALGSVTPAGMAGTVSIIWLDAEGKGLARSSLVDHGDFRDVAAVTTDAEGRFALHGWAPSRPVRLVFDGTARFRPAFAGLPAPH
ncbi:MAG: hypothetical protein J0H19_27415 [Rhodospirillales bacterium]|nr:hypothetical protein [Rhodospirillales bacterium]